MLSRVAVGLVLLSERIGQAVRMRAREAAHLIAALTEADVDIWVEGGWGVDALVGVETRTHKDLDLFVPLADSELDVARGCPVWRGTSVAGR